MNMSTAYPNYTQRDKSTGRCGPRALTRRIICDPLFRREVEQMTDSLRARLQNKIVNKLRTLYNFEHAE